MKLPKDLMSYCRKTILIRVIPCILLICIFASILLLWGDILINTDVLEFKISCYVLIMIIPFAITGVPHKLIDTTYCGKIKKVDIITTHDNDSSFKPTREHIYLKNTIHLTIEKQNGKLIYKKVYSGKARLQQHLDTYQVGDTVFHLYGTNQVIVLPNTTNTVVSCPVCGTANPIEHDNCRNCKHSLVKNI